MLATPPIPLTPSALPSSVARTGMVLGMAASGSLRYAVPQGGLIRIAAYTPSGRRTRVLYQGYRSPGLHDLSVPARLRSATHVFRLQYGGKEAGGASAPVQPR